ncbi:hypothetical protein QT920_009020 [Xanthomonas campestris pv. campestris]|uniref:hypothetical protein n=1 Tax=Xanthomonas campestris TaxID=339 RepID=UPI00358D2CE4
MKSIDGCDRSARSDGCSGDAWVRLVVVSRIIDDHHRFATLYSAPKRLKNLPRAAARKRSLELAADAATN